MTPSHAPTAKHPTIGVFDSGVGGLTVLRELLTQVPGANYLYFGDTARLPYGSKSAETVAKYAISAGKFLEEHGAQYLVIACNTATALALPAIQSAMQIPVLGVIGPGADAAKSHTKTGQAVVIGTEGTVNSHAYRDALRARGVQAYEKACPLFVPLVEEGWLAHPITEQVAHIYLDEAFKAAPDADVLLLGCTHYPLLSTLLRAVTPEHIRIVDSANSTAAAVAAAFPNARSTASEAPVQFFATDSTEKFRRAGEKFLARPIEGITHVDLES